MLADGTVVTVDMLVEGVHFNDRLSASDIGFKSIAVSVSDLAAMGAQSAWAVLALSIPAHRPASWVAELCAGIGEAARTWGIRIVGGDTTRSPGPAVISVTLGGALVAEPIRRSNAALNDDIWVTGTPGLAGAGYLLADPPLCALNALRRPCPPAAVAMELARGSLATAAMDLSDGIAADLPRLCGASGVGAVIDLDCLQIEELAAEHRELALTAGDDYQLLFTAPAAHRRAIAHQALTHRVRCRRIGHIDAGPGARLVDGSWPRSRFSHFGEAT